MDDKLKKLYQRVEDTERHRLKLVFERNFYKQEFERVSELKSHERKIFFFIIMFLISALVMMAVGMGYGNFN